MSGTAFVSTGDLKRGNAALSKILETAAGGGCSTSGGA